ncbi:MAG: RNA 2',3'-cyclic phosphodiesterase [Gaiellaceae bacterium]
MRGPASVEGDERLRLFLALLLPAGTVDAIVVWQGEALEGVDGVRAVPRENLHVTLAFLGHRPAAELEPIAGALREAVENAEPARLTLRGYRETRRVGMLTFDDEDGRATALAADLHARLEALGVYEPERRRWLPHVTVARFRQRPRLRLALPELKPFVLSDAAAYLSRLRPGGAQYEVLESMRVGGR